MSVTVYIKPDKNTEVYQKEVYLGQIAQIWCRDQRLEDQCKKIKVMTIEGDREDRYVISGIRLVELIQELDPGTEVVNMGEQDVIIDYQPKVHRVGVMDWIKTMCICLIVFFGGAFAIMTFNNDGSVSQIFQDVDKLVTGETENREKSQNQEKTQPQKKTIGVMILEISYSVGLILGVTIFFNHFGKHKVTIDPTPIEVQMRLYEDQVETTVIRNASRKETGIDNK